MAKAEKKSESSARKNLIVALAAIGVGDVKSPHEMNMIQELHSTLNPPRVRKTRKSKGPKEVLQVSPVSPAISTSAGHVPAPTATAPAPTPKKASSLLDEEPVPVPVSEEATI